MSKITLEDMYRAELLEIQGRFIVVDKEKYLQALAQAIAEQNERYWEEWAAQHQN